MYTGIGKLRVPSADQAPLLILAELVFPYPADQQAFKDELTIKQALLRAEGVAYLAACDSTALLPEAEERLLAGLRDTLNNQLFLGKVEELYFASFDVLP